MFQSLNIQPETEDCDLLKQGGPARPHDLPSLSEKLRNRVRQVRSFSRRRMGLAFHHD